jgi:hypothetical protein
MTREIKSYSELDECEVCGCAIGPCVDWPWHLEHEDCRAIRTPCEVTVHGD